ncbi:MAG: ribosomal RNA small subunit methyltransferase A [bacterium]|nr:ribosomal RNA small subunit methyltransferase A [bacterium]
MMKTKAKLGQNFLVNKNVAEKIVRLFLPAEGAILEVGPGKGVLTGLLVKYRKNNSIKAVELDMGLFYKLKSTYHYDFFETVNRNILKVDLELLFPGEKRINLISNVPYYISSEFIDWVISQAGHIKKGVLMLQKEFVDKLSSGPDSKNYNAQSVMFNTLFRFRKGFDVSPGSFFPQPRVKSSVFSFENAFEDDELKPVPETDYAAFYRFLRSSFKNRRKTLINNLEKQYHTETLWEIIETLHINPKIRAEQLTQEDFINIFLRIRN